MGGTLPIIDYTAKRRQKGVPFSDWRYIKGSTAVKHLAQFFVLFLKSSFQIEVETLARVYTMAVACKCILISLTSKGFFTLKCFAPRQNPGLL